MRSRTLLTLASALVLSIGARAASAGELTVCTQNLWNYGVPEAVHKLRRPEDEITKIRADLAKQEQALAERLAGCDIIAVQELLGEGDTQARSALNRLIRVLDQRTGQRYLGRMADTRDVIRNGFLVRDGAAFE